MSQSARIPTLLDMDFAIEMANWAQSADEIAAYLANQLLETSPQAQQKNYGFGAPGERWVLAKRWVADSAPIIIGTLRIARKVLDAGAVPPIFSNAAMTADFLYVSDPAWRARDVLAMLLQTAADFAASLQIAELHFRAAASLDSAHRFEPHQIDTETALLQQGFTGAVSGDWRKALPLQLPIARVGAVRAEIERPAAMLIGSKTKLELQAVYLQIAKLSRHELIIYTRDLDGQVLDSMPILDCLRALSLQKGARIRILVQDSGRALKDGHRLLELGRRMSSAFEFRSPQAEDLQYSSAFIVNDQYGHALRDLATRFESEGNLSELASAQRLKRYFDEVWERSPVTAEFRRLSF